MFDAIFMIIYLAILLTSVMVEAFSCENIYHNIQRKRFRNSCIYASINLIPTNKELFPEEIEILRILGKIDIQMDNDTFAQMVRSIRKPSSSKSKSTISKPSSSKASRFNIKESQQYKKITSVRVFEARLLDGTKCLMKEYLPFAANFGTRELKAITSLTAKWNGALLEKISEKRSVNKFTSSKSKQRRNPKSSSSDRLAKKYNSMFSDSKEIEVESENEMEDYQYSDDVNNGENNVDRNPEEIFPFPVLIGSLRPGSQISEPAFLNEWRKTFPTSPPPEAGNLWLVYKWDRSTFNTLNRSQK